MKAALLEPFKTFDSDNSQLISFEGIEGSGKSTQIKLLQEYLISQGKEVICLREPGGTDFGEGLRSAILNSKTALHPLAEAHLFASSRCQLLYEKIIPALKKANHFVLIDRYIHSSIAYQGIGRGLGIDTVLKIHHTSPLNTLPHKTFYLEIDVDTSLARQNKRGSEKDYFELEAREFTQKLIEGFAQCKSLFPHTFYSLDGTRTQQEVFNSIIQEISL